jgi:uncharacterized protein YdcH (DUF465 family)
MDERAAREYLLENDSQFQQLVDEHQRFERQLAEFTGRPFLTVEEQFRETIIKKKKLALKDQMQMLIQRVRTQGSVN